MKIVILILSILTITCIATQAQTSRTYEASLEHVSVAYNYTPDTILHASLIAGHRENTYSSARITVRPLVIKSKIANQIIEPIAFFEFGYDGSTFNNYGFGAMYHITKSISASVKYSSWGVTGSITLQRL